MEGLVLKRREDVLEQANITSIAEAWDLECVRSLSLKSTL